MPRAVPHWSRSAIATVGDDHCPEGTSVTMRTANEIAVASAVLVLAGGAAAADGESDTGGKAGDGATASGTEHAADQAAAGSAERWRAPAHRSRPANVRTAPERQPWARACHRVGEPCVPVTVRHGARGTTTRLRTLGWQVPRRRLDCRRRSLEERILNLLSSQNMCVLATAGAGGPSATPVRYYHLDFTVVFTARRARPKLRNIAEDPRVSVGVFSRRSSDRQAVAVLSCSG